MTVICFTCRRQHGEHDDTCELAFERRRFEPPAYTARLVSRTPEPRPFLAPALRDSMRQAVDRLKP